MYSFTTDGNYKIVKLLNVNKYPNQDNYYSNLNQNNRNTPYNFQVPVHNISEHLYPVYKMNSERYFPNERIIFDHKNNYSNYNTNIYHLNNISNDFIRVNNFQNTTGQDEKYYYNERVVVHKRNVNSIRCYNNNSIHFIRTSSNKKNDRKKQNNNSNRNMAYMNNKKDRMANEIIGRYENKDTSNNYNRIRIEKNSRFNRNKNRGIIELNKNIYINNNINGNLNNYANNYGFNRNVIKINDGTNYTFEKIGKNNNIIEYQNINRNEDDKNKENSKLNDEIGKLIKEKENLQKKLNEVMNENKELKIINLNNQNLAIKNKTLTEKLNEIENKVKKLEKENENYINEIDNNKNIKILSDNEIKNIYEKLKIVYLKLIVEKKMIQNKKNLQKYFLKFNDIANKIRQIENDGKNYKNFVDEISTSIKNNNIYKKIEEDKIKEEEERKAKEKEDLINKRNKKLKELVNNKIRQDNALINSAFSKFYYKGLINEIKNQQNNIVNPQPQQVQENNNIQPQVEQPPKIEQPVVEQPQVVQPPISEQPKIEEPKKEEACQTLAGTVNLAITF